MVARNRVPSETPCAPSANAAAIPSTVRDAAGRDHRCLAGDVNHRGHQDHGRDPASVSSGLLPLRDENVGPRLKSNLGRVDVPDRLDPQDPPLVRLLDQVGWDAHVEGDSHRLQVERLVEGRPIKWPPGVVHSERPLSLVSKQPPLLLQLGDAAHRRADAAQPAGIAHRGGQPHLVPRPKGSQHQGKVDAKQ